MERMPDTRPRSLTAEQRAVHDAIVAGPRGRVPAPLMVWLASPPMADIAQRLGTFCRFDSTIPRRLAEIAIVTTAAYWKAGFEWQPHAAEAVKHGISAQVLEAIRTGRQPEFETAEDAAVHAFARELLTTQGASDATFAQVRAVLGERATVELVGTIGYYTMISLTIATFQVPLEIPGPDPFADLR
jgi:4-carboxymuconolactone decarboxylase